MRKDRIRTIALLVFSFCGAMALNMKFPTQLTPKVWGLDNIFYEFRLSLNGTAVSSSVAFGLLYFAGKTTYSQWRHRSAIRLLSVLFAVAWLFSAAVDTTGVINETVAVTPAQAAKSVIYLIGMSYFLFLCGQLLYKFCTKGSDLQGLGEKEPVNGAGKHSFVGTMLVFLAAWIPYLVLEYPARISWDSWREMSMFFGYWTFTAHDPPAHTVLISTFVNIGKALGSANIGFFLFVVIQMLAFSSLLSYEICMMKRLGAPKWLIISTYIAGAVSTVYAFYSIDILKDCQYAHCFLLMMIEMVVLLKQKQSFFHSKKHVFLIALSIVGVMLFRKNGKYIIYVLAAAAVSLIIGKSIRNGRQFLKRIGLRPIVVFLIPILFAEVINASLVQYFDIGESSIREVLSLPFQQTARYVTKYQEEIPDEEAEIIGALLDYDNLPQLYKPAISDPVKRTYNNEATSEGLIEYLKVWAKQFFRHPLTYVEAAVCQTYPLYYPFRESIRARYAVRDEAEFTELTAELEYPVKTAVPNGNEIAQHWGVLLYRLPVIGLFSSQAVYVLLLVYLTVFSILDRNKGMLCLLFPLVLSIGVVFVSPTVLNHERYAFPFIFATPITLAYLHHSYSAGKTCKGTR